MSRFITVLLALMLLLGAIGIKGYSNQDSAGPIIKPEASQKLFDPIIKNETEEVSEEESEEETTEEEDSSEDEDADSEEKEEESEDSEISANFDSGLFDVYNGYGGYNNDFSPQEEINYAVSQNSVESNFWKTKTVASPVIKKQRAVVASSNNSKRVINSRKTETEFLEEQAKQEALEEDMMEAEEEETTKDPTYTEEAVSETLTKGEKADPRPESLKVQQNTFYEKVYIYDTSLNLSKRNIPAGPVTFTISNLGNFSHIFTISGTGISLKVLPGKTVVTNAFLSPGTYYLSSDKSLEKNIEFIGEYSEKRQSLEKRIVSTLIVQ